MVCQTTDSGSSNPLLAKELEKMFMAADDPVLWRASKNQIRCYCHKLALTVKDALALINVSSGPTKPTKPTGRSLHLILPKDALPTPEVILDNVTASKATDKSDWVDVEEGEEEEDGQGDCSDCEVDEVEPNPTPDEFDSDNEASGDEGDDEPYNEPQDTGPILSRSLIKVCTTLNVPLLRLIVPDPRVGINSFFSPSASSHQQVNHQDCASDQRVSASCNSAWLQRSSSHRRAWATMEYLV